VTPLNNKGQPESISKKTVVLGQKLGR